MTHVTCKTTCETKIWGEMPESCENCFDLSEGDMSEEICEMFPPLSGETWWWSFVCVECGHAHPWMIATPAERPTTATQEPT